MVLREAPAVKAAPLNSVAPVSFQIRFHRGTLLMCLLLLSAALPCRAGVTLDVSVNQDLSQSSTQITTPSFSTSSPNELLLAFIASDGLSSPMIVSNVSGGGLTWIPVARVNATGGTSEIWRAFAIAPVSNVTVTATLAQKVFASIQVVSFSGVDTTGMNGAGAIGAVATASGSGAPSASLVTTRANSLIFGVGNDFNNAKARTVGTGQTLIHQDLSTINNDTYWIQRQTNPISAAGTNVKINDTAPTGDHFNLAICEILPPGGTTTPGITSLNPSSGVAGTSVTIFGTNFGSSPGNGNVTFGGVYASIVNWTATSITALVPYGATTGNVVVAASDGISSNGASFTVNGPAAGLAIDAYAKGDATVPGTQLSTNALSTSSANELLLAFIATDALSAGMQVNSVNGGGLTWVLVKRGNQQLGDTEIWRAFAPSPLSNATVTATLAQSVVGSIEVLSFTGADASGTNGSGAIGATSGGNANPGAPSASLATTRAGSWVFGVGNDYDKSISRTLGAGQALLHQFWSPTNDTYWMQRLDNTTSTSGTSVTINDVAPSTDRYNLSLVEVLPSAANPPVVSSVSPNSDPVGATVNINGSNFGSTQGASTVTFGGVAASPTTWTSQQITVPVPAGAAVGSDPVVVTTAQGASNSAAFTVVAPLVVVASSSPAANANGWNNTNVTISYQCSGGVLPVQCPGSRTVTTEGANQVFSATALDTNGNAATVTTTLSIDKTSPAIVATVTPSPTGNSVVTAPATITFTCSDSLSGIATCPSPVQVNSPGASEVFSGTAVDKAGNSASASVTLNVESAALALTTIIVPPPNTNGWNNSDVTVSYTCSGGVPPVTCPTDQTVTGEGMNQIVNSSATDAAGAVANSSVTLNIEKTPPGITANSAPAANAAGWNNSPVTVTFSCSPSISPLGTCPQPQTVSNDGGKQPVSGTVTDQAGNSATAAVQVSLDQTPPTIIAVTVPPLGPKGISTSAITVKFKCSDATSGVAQCSPPVTVSSSGSQTLSGTATDQAGNTASTSITVDVETAPLLITATALPQPNAAGWNNTDVIVTFQCSGGIAPIHCPLPKTLSKDGKAQTATGVAIDAAGRTATATAVVNIDKTSPVLNVTSPLPGVNVTSGQIVVRGLISDALSGVSTVTCNGSAATISGTSFTCNVVLSIGANSIAIAAQDVAGNHGQSTFPIGYATPINLQIASPTPLELFSSNPITVTGTVDRPNATVVVGDVTATVNNGVFTASGVVLRESKNLLTAAATSPDGGVGSATVTVYLDTTPPTVHIDNPVAGAIVNTTQIDVTGNVNDFVTGTVNGDQVSVVVNGVTAAVANRSFAAHNILLVPGVNSVTAVATDRAGNISQHQVQVTMLQAAAQQTVSILSGNHQSASIGTVLPQPLAVQATDALGRPMANATLTFAVVKSDGLIVSGQQQGRTLNVQTDSSGKASVQFQLGSRNGVGINQVGVSAPGFVGQTIFSEDSLAGAPTQIHTVSGEVQTGAVGTSLPEPLVTIVFDAGANPIANVPVTFTVKSGGGLINGQSTFTQNTDSDGKASAILVLGQQEGVSNNVVTASFSGLTKPAAVFTSSGVVPGPVSITAVSGIVLDDANEPIVNATASIKGTNLSAVTDVNGHFTIPNAPVGDIVLFVDGSTSTDVDSYPTLSFQMSTIPGRDNKLPGPIFLPALDTDNSQVVGGAQDVVLTMKNVPGVEYKVFANSVTFPDGSHVGRLTLSQVHADRVPMTPPNGTSPRLVGTLQPAGVKFDPPIQMTLPNTEGLAPGQVQEIFSFHHDVEQFVVEGTARVSEDGSVFVTDPGFGLTVSGWHGGGGNPPDPTCTDDCGAPDACNSGGACVDGSCVFGSPVADGTSCGSAAPSSCQAGACTGGECVMSPAADGTDCSDSSTPQCSVATCQGGTCTNAQADDGTDCSPDDQCKVGECQNGTCNATDPKEISDITMTAVDDDNPDGVPQEGSLVKVAFRDENTYPVTFQAVATNNCDSVTYNWDFGDGGGAADDDTPTHAYAAPGKYTVTVTVQCDECAQATKQATMIVAIATVSQVNMVVTATPNPVNAAANLPDTQIPFMNDSDDPGAGGANPGKNFPSGLRPFRLSCQTNPPITDPDVGADILDLLTWSVKGADDPNAAVPTLTPNGAQATITTDKPGTFNVSCFLDDNQDGNRDDNEPRKVANLTWVQIQPPQPIDINNAVNSRLIQQGPLSPNGVRITTGAFDFANAANDSFFLEVNLTLVGGGGDQTRGVDHISISVPQNITNITLAGNYPHHNSERYDFVAGAGNPLCPGNNAAVLPFPIIDTGNLAFANGSPPADQGGDFVIDNQNQPDRTVTTADSPGLFFDGIQACDLAGQLGSTSGTIFFSTYLVAFSDDAPHSYSVIGVANWTTTWQGTVTLNNNGNYVWHKQAASKVSSSGFLTAGYPRDAADVGLTVYTPVGLNVLKRDAR